MHKVPIGEWNKFVKSGKKLDDKTDPGQIMVEYIVKSRSNDSKSCCSSPQTPPLV